MGDTLLQWHRNQRVAPTTARKGKTMTTYTINTNEEFRSIEISFDGKPSEAIRDALKALRFRWHGVKKVWYGYRTEEEARQAIQGAENGTEAVKASKAPAAKAAAAKVNKFGVKVGDLFYTSWGYEQSNVNFFQVVALAGESSVRVIEVTPPMISDEAVSSMAADRTYKTKDVGILRPCSCPSFVKDQEKGDVKRLKSYAKDGKSHPQFLLSSYASAYLCEDDTKTLYESWYA